MAMPGMRPGPKLPMPAAAPQTAATATPAAEQTLSIAAAVALAPDVSDSSAPVEAAVALPVEPVAASTSEPAAGVQPVVVDEPVSSAPGPAAQGRVACVALVEHGMVDAGEQLKQAQREQAPAPTQEEQPSVAPQAQPQASAPALVSWLAG